MSIPRFFTKVWVGLTSLCAMALPLHATEQSQKKKLPSLQKGQYAFVLKTGRTYDLLLVAKPISSEIKPSIGLPTKSCLALSTFRCDVDHPQPPQEQRWIFNISNENPNRKELCRIAIGNHYCQHWYNDNNPYDIKLVSLLDKDIDDIDFKLQKRKAAITKQDVFKKRLPVRLTTVCGDAISFKHVLKQKKHEKILCNELMLYPVHEKQTHILGRSYEEEIEVPCYETCCCTIL